jgi:hypothetical protein
LLWRWWRQWNRKNPVAQNKGISELKTQPIRQLSDGRRARLKWKPSWPTVASTNRPYPESTVSTSLATIATGVACCDASATEPHKGTR